MSFVVQMGLNENEKQIPKHSWQSKKGNQTYARYSKKYNTQKTPKVKHGPAKPKAERKSRKNNNNNNNNNMYNTINMPSSSSTLAMYNPASYFQYSNTVSVYSSDVSLVKHKAKLVGTSPPPPPRGKKERKEEAAGTYHRPKFDKMIEPIVRNSRLDHSYFKGASDPLPVPAPLPSPYKSRSPLSNSVNGLSNKYHPHPHPTGKRPPTPPKSPVHNTTPLLPIFNQLPNSKSVFGIARAVSPPTKSSPLHQSQSTSYLVPQHPLIPPMPAHHLLSLNPRLPNSLKKENHQGRHSESSCDEERDPDPQGEETETAPENDAEEDEQERRRGGVLTKDTPVVKEMTIPAAEPLPPPPKEGAAVDDSVTRCVCGFLHDDGYMICCDQCQVWQHVDCMEIDRQNIPDEYLCEECSPRRVDKMKAIGIQIQKIKRLTDKTVRDNDDDVNSDSSHSSQERPRQRGGARKGKAAAPKTPKPRGKRGSNTAAGGTGVRRRKSGGPAAGTPNSISPAGVTPPAVKNKKMGAGVGTPTTTQPSPPNMNNILHSNNKRKMITVAEKKQNHSSKNNTSTSGKVLSPLNHHKITSGGINEKKNHTGVKRMGKKQQEKKLLNNNHKRKNSTLLGALSSSLEPPAKKDKESPTAGSSLLCTTPSKPVPPPVEQTATSSDEEDSKPMTRWIDNYEEATCNYYAPDLRARIATIKLNGTHQDTGVKLPASLLSTTVQKCRASLLSSGTKILVTSTNMSSNQALIEMRGKYLLGTGDRKNVPSPGQHVFFYAMLHEGIDIIIDCKTYGNDARFVRRSCKPNAVMKHCIDKGSIHIYLTALYSIPKNSEVTVAYSSGGNPDQCTCGDKATCTAAAQKTKLYTERKHQQTQETVPSPVKSELKPSVPPSPPAALPPPTPSEIEKVEVKDEEEEEEEKKPEVVPIPVTPTPTSITPPVTPVKKEKEPKPATITISEKARKPSVDEKPKSISESETVTTSSSAPADSNNKIASPPDTSNSPVKKEQDSEKKSVVVVASEPKRKKSVGKRKYSESSQSLESEGNNTEDDDETTSKISTRRNSASVTTNKSTPNKKETPNNTPTKLSREERKLEAIMKAFERMEKSANRQKESRVRKDSTCAAEKQEETIVSKNKIQQPPVAKANKRIVRKRKGRSKSLSISTSTRSRRTTRATGHKEEETSSGEEDEDMSSDTSQPKNSVQTPPPSFKLPFSKKTPDDANQDPESPEKPAGGCAKKRWLRQAISEECESPRSDSPTLLGTEQAGPLKKRRLARASLSSDDKNFTPPTTPVPDEDTSTPPHDTAHPPLTPKTAYACLTTSSNEPTVPPVAVSTDSTLTTVTSPPERPLDTAPASKSEVEGVLDIKSGLDSTQSCKSEIKTNEAPITPSSDVTPSTTVQETSAPTDIPLPPPSPVLPSKELPPSSLPPPRRFEPPNTLDITIPLLLPTPRSCLPVSNLHLPSPQALESSLQNSTDFSMPSTQPPTLASNFFMSSWPPVGSQGAPSSTVTPSPPQEPFTPPPPVPPVKEKIVTKRKLSISEYRQRKGVTSLASPTPALLEDHNERRGSSSSKEVQGGCSPPTSSSSDEEGDGDELSRHSSVNVGATRVIEKSVLVDNLIAKISKSADSLSDNKDFKDPQFTRIPKVPSVLNNNQQPKKPAKPDSFLERPKENLMERLNREFNIRLSDGPPIGLPKPMCPLPPGVMPPTVQPPPPIYEDLTSDLYIPIASRSHTPRSLKK